MVNAFNDLDFNGALFYYKGHCLGWQRYGYLDNIEITYFNYNGKQIFMTSNGIQLSDKTGNKKYSGKFFYSIEEVYDYLQNVVP
jgi:hypothetical protein